ncbi:MAG: glycosyltransferase [Isosphaeraceae bacterium]|nr:glycosyltransferase [Isosphaeraceae bacterium]
MPERPLRILQVSIADILGGAEKVAWDLFQAYKDRGHQSWLAVGTKYGNHPDVRRIPNPHPEQSLWFNFWRRVYGWLQPLETRKVPGAWRITHLVWELARLRKWLDRWRELRALRVSMADLRNGAGEADWDLFWDLFQDFQFPETWRLLDLPPQPPDIVHCHNLHSNYFDLRSLPWLSHRVPVVLSLHDAWLLSGLCLHSLDCERWKTGCGQCPLLPSGHQESPWDVTHLNWRRKAKIYAESQLNVTTACHWMMRKVEQSILAPALRETRVIPYGVDLSLFTPAEKAMARVKLALPPAARVFFFVAHGLKDNPSKDYETIRTAIHLVARRQPGQQVLFIARGAEAPPEQMGQVELRFLPFQKDYRDVIHYYQAADVYLHAAHADTFPLAILEALACGTPVVATAVGGIPEQLKSLGPPPSGGEWKAYPVEEATGILVPPKDAEGMAAAIARLLGNEALRHQLSQNAAWDARERFDVRRQVSAYLDWYTELRQSTITR